MRKKRTISIRHRRLRFVRNNLRRVLINVCRAAQSKIQDEYGTLMRLHGFYENPELQKKAKRLNDLY